jgi:Ser/Thr protein kinase RdoA (MazF antagonist)
MPSTTAPERLRSAAAAALGAYDLPAPVTVAPIRLLGNSVYAVTAGDGRQFALRLHTTGFRTEQHTRSELVFQGAIHGRLAAERITVPTAVPTRDGRLTAFSPEIDTHCDLLTWVEGTVRRPGGGLGACGVHQLGRALGHLHRAAERFEPPTDFVLPRWDAEAMFTERSPYRPDPISAFLTGADMAVFASVADRTAEIFASLGTGPDAFGLIHNDFILGNCHTVRRRAHGFDVGILDFDDCGWGHYLFDLAAVMGNLSDYAHFSELRAAFLAGYRSVRPLPVALEAHLPVLMAARHAAQCLWAAGLSKRPFELEFDTADHIAYRLWEIRRCLAMDIA